MKNDVGTLPNGYSTSGSEIQYWGTFRKVFCFWFTISITMCYLFNVPSVTSNNFSLTWNLFINKKLGHFCFIFGLSNFICIFIHICAGVYFIVFSVILLHFFNIYLEVWTDKIIDEISEEFNDDLIDRNLRKFADVVFNVSR